MAVARDWSAYPSFIRNITDLRRKQSAAHTEGRRLVAERLLDELHRLENLFADYLTEHACRLSGSPMDLQYATSIRRMFDYIVTVHGVPDDKKWPIDKALAYLWPSRTPQEKVH